VIPDSNKNRGCITHQRYRVMVEGCINDIIAMQDWERVGVWIGAGVPRPGPPKDLCLEWREEGRKGEREKGSKRQSGSRKGRC
jgi:hypothetical protein